MSRYVEISASCEFGSGEGYCVESVAEQIENWLDKYGAHDTDLVAMIRTQYPYLALLNNINVFEEEDRGKGYGSELLSDLVGEAESHAVDGIFLVADTAESQQEGFSLVAWYEKQGFTVVSETPCGPLMVSSYVVERE